MNKDSLKKIEYSPEKADEYLKRRALRCSIICMFIIAVIAVISYYMINFIPSIYGINLNLFNDAKTSSLLLSTSSLELVGTENLKIGVSNVEVTDDMITFNIYGKNFSDNDWEADGSTFVVSSFNTNVAETRYHYYSDDWENISVPAHQQFSYDMSYQIPNVKNKMQNDYLFSLSAFRNNDFATIEMVFDDVYFIDDN